MHEMALAQNIINIVEQVMDYNGVKKVLVIHISADKMSLILIDSLRSCFDILTENTKLAGTVLDIKFIPLIYYCPCCTKVFPSENMIDNCINCDWENPIPIFGRSVKIEGIDVLNEVT